MRTTLVRCSTPGMLALVVLALASIAWPTSAIASTPLGANVIVNPGAESGVAGSGSGNPPPSWTRTGDFTQILYSTGNGYPTQSSPGPPNRGNAFFGGGYAASSTATQTLSIGDLASEIDASKITYDLSGWLGGYENQDDNMKLVATFRSSAGGSRSSRGRGA